MTYDRRELHEVLDSLLNETISAEQSARLQEMLRSNEMARKEYLSYIDIHLGIKDLEESLDDELLPFDLCVDRCLPKRQGVGRMWAWSLTTICSLVVLAAVVLMFNAKPAHQNAEALAATGVPEEVPSSPVAAATVEKEAAPVVVLTQAANAELHLQYIPAVGSPLQLDHEYVLLKGLMELTFANGATATLKSPSVFTVKSATRMEMKIGNCSVHAPDSAKGFEVVTPQSRIVDLGTRFSVSTNESGASDVQVVEGAVEVYPPDDVQQRSMLLEGEAVRLTNSSPHLQSIEFNRNSYQKPFPNRVVSYDATEVAPGQGVCDLTSVTVQREDQVWTYPVQDLIGIDVIHFSSYSIAANAACLGKLTGKIEDLLSDNVALTSGLVNFSRSPDPYRPAEDFTRFRERYGMAVQFRKPVINGPGPDVVLFEVQSAAYPASGDRFHVSPIENGPGLRTHLIERFDVTLNSSNARRVAALSSVVFESPIQSIEDFSRVNVLRVTPLAMPFYALAVGIDFSDLGYPAGAQVSGLFFEDAEDDEQVVMDPVFIGGLPLLPSASN